MTATTTPTPSPTQTAECVETSLNIGGMTCASCVRRVEKTLTRVDGVVAASVNLANETATVSYDPAFTSLETLTAAVAKSGYTAAPRTTGPATGTSPTTGHLAGEPAADSTPTPGPGQNPVDELDARRDTEIAHLKRRWQVALTTGLALMGVMYLPLYIDTMDWLMPLILVIATGVQLWAGADIYRQAWAAARHRATTMDTLVALGTGVAFGYSAFVTLWPAQAQRWGLPIHLYFETALIVVALVLMGRWLELKAKKRTAASIKTLFGLAPTTARVVRDSPSGTVRSTSLSTRWSSATSSASGPARTFPSTAASWKAHHRSTSRCSPASPSRSTSVPATRSSEPPRTAPAPWWFAPTPSAPTAPWPRSSAWSRKPKAPRPRCSGSPTRCPPGSCPRSCSPRWPRSSAG